MEKIFHSLTSKFIENPPVQNGFIQCQRIQGKIKCSNSGPCFLWLHPFFSLSFQRQRQLSQVAFHPWEKTTGTWRVCAVLNRRDPFCSALFLPPDGWRLLHQALDLYSTRFSPIVWYKSHKSGIRRASDILDMGTQPSNWAFTCIVEESGYAGVSSMRMALVSWQAKSQTGNFVNPSVFKCYLWSSWTAQAK